MPQFKSILLVNDGLSDEREAFKQALSQARNNDASLKVVTICPAFDKPLAPYQAKFEALLIERARESVAAACAALKISEDAIALSFEVEAGEAPAARIIRHVLRNGHDLVLKPAPAVDTKKGFQAIDMQLLRKCPCPVWLSRPISDARKEMKVAVAVDPEGPPPEGDALAVQLLRLARALADECDGKLEIVSAWDFPYEEYLRNSSRIRVSETELQEMVRETEKRRRDKLNLLLKTAAIAGEKRLSHLRGAAGSMIPEFVETNGVDILVMGTVARTGVAGFIMGNTAENVLRNLSCSLLALKPNGFVSPVKAW